MDAIDIALIRGICPLCFNNPSCLKPLIDHPQTCSPVTKITIKTSDLTVLIDAAEQMIQDEWDNSEYAYLAEALTQTPEPTRDQTTASINAKNLASLIEATRICAFGYAENLDSNDCIETAMQQFKACKAGIKLLIQKPEESGKPGR